jgi:hypothetical protein
MGRGIRTEPVSPTDGQDSSYLHGLCIQVAAPTSRDMHEKMLSYFEDQAERYWRSYTPMRKPKLVLGREVLR